MGMRVTYLQGEDWGCEWWTGRDGRFRRRWSRARTRTGRLRSSQVVLLGVASWLRPAEGTFLDRPAREAGGRTRLLDSDSPESVPARRRAGFDRVGTR